MTFFFAVSAVKGGALVTARGDSKMCCDGVVDEKILTSAFRRGLFARVLVTAEKD